MHKAGKLPPVDWLDRLSIAEVERIRERSKQSTNLQFLMVEFQQFKKSGSPVSVVYFEKNGHINNRMGFRSDIIRSVQHKKYCERSNRQDLIRFAFPRCPDFDIEQDNIVEAKHHRLARSQRAGQLDKDLKPNAETRNRLMEIVSYPATQPLVSEEQDLIWRFRYYLSSNKKALAKFVKCINWGSSHEATQALDLIHKWTPMDVEDALELLGPSFKHPGLRHYAVTRMREASDGDLQLYLLQLVQALKYENVSESWASEADELISVSGAGEANFIGGGAAADSSSSSSPPPPVMRIDPSGEDHMDAVEEGGTREDLSSAAEDTTPPSADGDVQLPVSLSSSESAKKWDGLASFLINRACNNSGVDITYTMSIVSFSGLRILHPFVFHRQRSQITSIGTWSSSARIPPRTD